MKILIFALCLVASLEASAETSDPSVDRAVDYSVWEVEILSAYKFSGQRFRIPTITPSRAAEIGAVVYWGKEILPPSKVLDASELISFKKSIEVGQSRTTESSFLNLESPFRFEKIKIRPLAKEKTVSFTVKLVKSCLTTLKTESESRIVNRGGGVIAVPTRETRRVTKITEASCYSASDRTFELSQSELTPEIESQKSASAVEEHVLAEKSKLEQKTREVLSELQTLAKNQSEKITWTHRPGADPLEKETNEGLCPLALGQLRVLDLSKIRFELRGTPSKSYGGYPSTRYSLYKVTVDRGGKKSEAEYDSAIDVMGVESVELSEPSCTVLSVRGGLSNPQELPRTLIKKFRRVLEDALEEKALNRVKMAVPKK